MILQELIDSLQKLICLKNNKVGIKIKDNKALLVFYVDEETMNPENGFYRLEN